MLICAAVSFASEAIDSAGSLAVSIDFENVCSEDFGENSKFFEECCNFCVRWHRLKISGSRRKHREDEFGCPRGTALLASDRFACAERDFGAPPRIREQFA